MSPEKVNKTESDATNVTLTFGVPRNVANNCSATIPIKSMALLDDQGVTLDSGQGVKERREKELVEKEKIATAMLV